MTTLRVVHYLNQFFAGIGAEDKADAPPGHRGGPVGPGRVLQQLLGDRGEVVATVYYQPRLHIASTPGRAAGMGDAPAIRARLALKLAAGTTLGSPADEGYV